MFQPELGPKYGAKTILEALATTTGGELAPENHHPTVLPVIRNTLENGRALRLQSLNNYRRYMERCLRLRTHVFVCLCVCVC